MSTELPTSCIRPSPESANFSDPEMGRELDRLRDGNDREPPQLLRDLRHEDRRDKSRRENEQEPEYEDMCRPVNF